MSYKLAAAQLPTNYTLRRDLTTIWLFLEKYV